MVAFSLKKSADGDKQKKSGFSGFSLKKGNQKPSQKIIKKPFGSTNDDDDEIKVEKIDTFDESKGGAVNEKDGGLTRKAPLVIENQGNTNWRKVARERFNPTPKTTTQKESKALEYGINFIGNSASETKEDESKRTSVLQKKDERSSYRDDIRSRPNAATLEEYEEIPVEDFGSAMLRGMGWNGDDDDENDKDESKGKPATIIPLVKRAPYLGLGAKNVANGDQSPLDKTYVPVKLVGRKTGRDVTRDKERDRSPQRASNGSYRDRE